MNLLSGELLGSYIYHGSWMSLSQLHITALHDQNVLVPQVTPEMRVDDAEFEENEVYAIDIVVRVPLGLPDIYSSAIVGVYE